MANGQNPDDDNTQQQDPSQAPQQPLQAPQQPMGTDQAQGGQGGPAGTYVTPAGDPSQQAGPENLTQIPAGVPTPDPVIDRNTRVKQARTFIDDAAVVANRQITPAESHQIDQRLMQVFDEGTQDAQDLAEVVATELQMQPSWTTVEGTNTPMMQIQGPGLPQPPAQG